MSIFDKPVSGWSDAELDAGARVLCDRRSELAATGRHEMADFVADLMEQVIAEQESRAGLAREVDAVFVRSWVETRPGEDTGTVTP